MSTAPPADEVARERARGELGTCLAVEAAAGAGKTSVLVARLLNLIRSGRRLGRIVAMTFTEKAAGELAMRVREEIEKALDGPLDDAERERFEQALDDLGQAHIGTIHGFCAGLLRERPAEAGVDPQFAVADEMAASVLRDRAWNAWLEAELAAGNPALLRAVACGVKLDKSGKTVLGLAEKLLDCVDLLDGMPARPANWPGVEAVRKQLFLELEQYIAFMQTNARGAQAQKHLNALEGARRSLALSGLMSEPSAEAAFLSARIGKTALGRPHWASKDAHKKGRDAHDALWERLGAAQRQLKQDLAAAIGQALLGFVAAYQRAKDAEGFLDFTDLLLLTRNMLRDVPAARQHFKERFDCILIDEFQDTDPLQVEVAFFLAERLDRHAACWEEVELAPGKLFIVGDPKQSIYRFRRADIEVYERAKERVRAQGDEVILSTSFRPVPGIAEAVNAIFAPIIKKPVDGLYQPDYVALRPHRAAGEGRPAVVLLHPPPEAAAAIGNADDARRLEARCVAAIIRRIVEDERWEISDSKTRERRPIGYRDIAILARTFTSTDHYSDELAAAGVPLRIVGGKHFYVAHEVHALLNVLKAIGNPHDAVAVVAALRGPFFGVSDDELLLATEARGRLNYLDVGHTGLVGQAAAVLRELHLRRNSEGIALLIQRFLERTKGLELLALRPRGEQRVANVLKVVQQARALEAEQGVSFRGFVRWLDRLQATEVRETESPSSEAGDDFVQFLSIHGAKGLEFPAVFVADMTSPEKRGTNFVVFRDRSPAEGQLAFYLGDSDKGIRSPNWPDDDYEARRADAEMTRLLYVATTRARDFLFLMPGWGKEQKNEGLVRFLRHALPLGEPEWGAATPVGVVYDTGTLRLRDPAPRAFCIRPPEDDALAPAALARLEARQRWLESTQAALAAASRGLVVRTPSRLGEGLVAAGEEAEPGAGAQEGRLIGSLVHDCLERATLNEPAALQARLRAEARRLGLADAAATQAQRLLDAALASPIMERARAASAAYHEVPFAIEVQDTLLIGAIDLLFVEGGRATIVDWKTDGVRDETELAQRAAAYRLQALAYALAVKTLLCTEPQEVVLFFLAAGREWPIPVNEAALEEAARAVASQEL